MSDTSASTRHFDLLIAVAIAWQMNVHARPKENPAETYQQRPYEPISAFEGGRVDENDYGGFKDNTIRI